MEKQNFSSRKSLKSFSDYISGRNLVCTGTSQTYSCKSLQKTKINKQKPIKPFLRLDFTVLAWHSVLKYDSTTRSFNFSRCIYDHSFANTDPTVLNFVSDCNMTIYSARISAFVTSCNGAYFLTWLCMTCRILFRNKLIQQCNP